MAISRLNTDYDKCVANCKELFEGNTDALVACINGCAVVNAPKDAIQIKIQKEQKILEKQVEEILEKVEQFEREAEKKKLNVTTVTREQLEKKLAESDSPMIVFQSWSGGASSPGSLDYNVGIHNPDPVTHIWTFAHVFVGLANIVPSVGAAAAAVDPRFARLTLPKFAGLSIAPSVTETLSFSIPIPAGIEDSNYLGNTFLFKSTWHDVGKYLDRSIFVFEVA